MAITFKTYDEFAFARNNLTFVPINKNLIVHEILKDIYSRLYSGTKTKENKSVGIYKAELSVDIDNIFGTFESYIFYCEKITRKLLEAFRAQKEPAMTRDQWINDLTYKIVRDTKSKYQVSMADSNVILVAEKTENESHIFYLHIPDNVAIA